MKPEQNNSEDIINKAIEEIRNDTPPPEAMAGAANRVWEKLNSELKGGESASIQGCEGFRALLPAYRAGELSEARALLVRDHLHECIACRKEFMTGVRVPEQRQTAGKPRFSVPRWAIAAAVILAAALSSYELFQRFGPPPDGPAAVVQTAEGYLFKLVDGESVPLSPNATLAAGEMVRLSNGATATLQLRDGSLVELREHSGMTIRETRRDVTLQLARGAVIVEAAKRASGHLYVSTRDCRVAVTGTVFSVNSGTKGSRVAVIEGEVRVAQGSRRSVLHPGQQYQSSSLLTPVALSDEIAWSQKAAEHIALMNELATLGEQMEQRVSMPEPRRGSEILDSLPAETVIYVSLPNLGNTMSDAWQVFQQRLQQSETLRQWWEQGIGAEPGSKMSGMVDEIQRFGAYFGEEIVVAATMGVNDEPGAPVLVSTLRQSNFVEFVRAEAAKLGPTAVHSFDSAAAIAQPEEEGILIYTSAGKVAISSEAVALRQVAGALEGTAPAFAGTSFHERILPAYSGGATLLIAADVTALSAGGKDMDLLGNFKYVIGSQRQQNGVTDSRGTITFDGQRTGMAAWLAEPAPIGALDYVSPEATVVTAFAAKDAIGVFDEMVVQLPDLKQHLDGAGAKFGFNFRDDLAQAFGHEFVFAMDGPILPTPSWKLIAEVHDEENLALVLRKTVEVANEELAKSGRPLITLAEEEDGGRRYIHGTAPDAKTVAEWHIVFTNGYMIVAPSRALLDKAIGRQSAGNNLLTSDKFTSMLPTDGYNNFSAMVYHDLKSATSAVTGLLTDEQKQAVEGLEKALKPTLILAYGAEDRITVASTSDALGFTPSNLFGLKMPLSLGAILGGEHEQPEPETNPVV